MQRLCDKSEMVFGLTEKQISSQRFLIITNRMKTTYSAKGFFTLTFEDNFLKNDNLI